jgi:alpha-tubulin suppressor-like RCC1 family protein
MKKHKTKTLLFILAQGLCSILSAQVPYIKSAEGGNRSAQIKFGIDDKVIFVASGPAAQRTFIIKSDSSLWGFGQNDFNQLGDNTTANRLKPVRIGLDNDWVYVATSRYYTMGIKADGTLWGWGNNNYGQLGDGTSTTRTIPIQIGTDRNWKSVTMTVQSTFAMKTDGSIWSWGDNSYGWLGRGFQGGNYLDIKQIGTSTSWKQLTCGFNFCLALQDDGSLYSWGYNGKGQLGDSTSNNVFAPKKIGSDFVQVAAAEQTSMGIKKDSTIWAWGDNYYGIYGDSTTTVSAYPIQTVKSKKWKSLAVGNLHAIGLQYDGTVWGWGYEGTGALGDSTYTNRYYPAPMLAVKNIKKIFAGAGHSLVLNDSGSLLGCGINSYGELGLGSTTPYNYAQTIQKAFVLKNFALYRSINPISDTATIGLVSDSISSTMRSFIDTGLTNTNRYYYRIKAIDKNNIKSKFSNQVRVAANQPPPSLNFSKVEGGPRRIYMTWPQSSASNVKYRIYRGTTSTNLKAINDTTYKLNYLDSSLLSGYFYYYAIRVIDSLGVPSSYSKIVKIGASGRCYVDVNGTNNSIGSVSFPISSIPLALSRCMTGDTIIVKDGIYTDPINFGNKGIVLSSEFLFDKDTAHIRKTRLDGQNHFGNTFFINGPSNQYLPFQIIGLTIENVVGRALSINNLSNSTVRDVCFEHIGTTNTAFWASIDVYGNVLFDKCVFRYNPAGSFLLQMSSANGFATMDRCIWYENGGSLTYPSRGLIWTNRMLLKNSYFYHNYCGAINGGCNQGLDTCHVINNAFVENYSHAFRLENCGGGLTYFFDNNIFENNKYTFGWENSGFSVVFLRNNLIKDLYRKSSGYPNKSWYKVFLSNNDTLSESGIKYPINSIYDIKFPWHSKCIGSGITTKYATTDFNQSSRPNPSGTSPDLGPIETPAFFASPKLQLAEGGNQKITLTWSQSTFTGLNKYKLYRSTNPISDTATVGLVTDTLSSKTLTYKDSGLTNLTKYYYRIKSLNSAGLTSGFSNEMNARPNTPPTGVDTLLVQNGPRLNYLKWTASKSSSVKYRIYRGLSKTTLQVIKDTTSKLNFLDTGLTAWKTYHYAVRAIDSVRVPSVYSAIKTGTPNNIWWVDTKGNDNNFGAIVFPLKKVQTAIDRSVSNDTIYIEAGTYNENLNFKGKNLTMSSKYKLQNDTSLIKKTILNGGNKGYVVELSNYETKKSVIQGLTITNGWVGINLVNSSPQLLDLRFTDNKAFSSRGSAIVGYMSPFLVDGCVFENHTGTGGVITISGNFRGFNIRNSIIRNNTSQSLSMISTDQANGTIENVLIYNNGDVQGVGVINAYYGVSIINSTIITGNAAPVRLLYNNIHRSKINVLNSILWSSYNGKQIEINNNNPITYLGVSNSVIKGGIQNIEQLNTTVLDTGSTPTIWSKIPDYVNANNYDFRLANKSEYIGKGAVSKILNSDTIWSSKLSINGVRPLPAGSNPDLGAYENSAAFPSPTILTTEGGNQKTTLTWSQSTFTGLNKYKLYRSTNPISDTATVGLVTDTLSSKTLTYKDSGLTNLTKYYYRIKSVNSAGLTSGFSNEMNAKPNIPPLPPDSIKVVNGPHRINLTWPASKTSPVTYNLVRSITGQNDVNFNNISAQIFEDTTVTDGLNYTYKVCAVDTVGVKSSFTKSKKGRSYRLIFVSSKGKDTLTNGYELNPMKTIQYAIDRSRNGDTILVEKGKYKENIIFRGKEIILASRFILNGNKQFIDSTIIDGDSAGCVVRIINGEGNGTQVSGLVIQNGYANAGAGFYVYAKKLKINNVIVRNNLAAGDIDGGGGYFWANKLQITNSVFYNNKGRKGGAIALVGGDSAWMVNDEFYDNNGWECGSSIIFVGGQSQRVYLNNCLIHDEDGSNSLWCQNPTVFINNSTIVNNTPNSGGPVNYMYSGTMNFNNCIIRNPSGKEFESLVSSTPGNIVLTNCNVKGGYTGTSNFDEDPRFISNAYKLSNSSTCIGKGNNNNLIQYDREGSVRPLPSGSKPDLGAYENVNSDPGPILDSLRVVSDTIKVHAFVTTNTLKNVYFNFYDSSKNLLYTDSLSLSNTKRVYLYKTLKLSRGFKYWVSISLNSKTIAPSELYNFAYLLQPKLLKPNNNAVNQSMTPILKYSKTRHALKYKVQLSTSKNFSTNLIDQTIGTDSLKLISALKNNTYYYWRVRSVDNNGFSRWSDTFRLQTKVQSPTITTRSTIENQVTLNWKITDTTNMFKFYIYRDTASSAQTLIDSVSATARTYVDNNVQAGTRYYYRIKLENKQYVLGDYSNEGSVSVLQNPSLLKPSNFSVNQSMNPVLKHSKTRYSQQYKVQLSTSKNFTTTLIDQTITADSLKIVSTLKYSTYYYWRVRSVDSIGYSRWSDTFRLQTKVQSPTITTRSTIENQATLNWKITDTTNMFKFYIYRDTASSAQTLIDSVSATARTYVDNNVQAATKYYYRIKLENNQFLLGNFSNEGSVSVLQKPTLLKPSNFSVNQSMNPVLKYSKTRYSQQYRVQLSTSKNFTTNIVNQIITADSLKLLSALKYSTYYYWRVRSVDSIGYSRWSDTFRIQTMVQTPTLTTRNTIENQVTINWKISDTTNLFKFYIYRDTTSTAQTLIDSVSAGARSYVDNNVEVSTRYFYRIRLENNQYVLGTYSNEGSASVLQKPTLITPNNFSVNQSMTPVLKYIKTRYSQQYKVQLSTTKSFTSNIIDQTTAGDSLKLTSPLKFSTYYYWRVRSLDSIGYSRWSDTFQMQTKVQTPTITARSTKERQVTVNWKMTDTTNMFKFYIYRDTTTTAQTLIDSVNFGASSFVDSNVQVSTKYYYRIRLENNQFILSDHSNEVSAAVLDKPTLLTPVDTLKKVQMTNLFKWTNQRYADSYRVQIAYNDSVKNPWFNELVKGADSIQIVLKRYNYGHFWRVRSEDSIGYSAWSNVLTYQTLLKVPKIDSSRSGNKKVKLYWTQSDTQNIKYYYVYRSLSNSFSTGFSPIGVVNSNSNQSKYSYLDSGLSNFTKYYYWIKAVNNQSVKSEESLVDSNKTFNVFPIAYLNKDTAFNNVGRLNRVKRYFLQTAAYDKDGWIDSTVWYIDNIRVSNDDSLKYKFRQGTTKITAVVFDNDQASDTNTFFVHQLTYKKTFRGGLINGVTVFNEDNIFVSDTSLNSFNLGEIVCLDTNGNTKINYLVKDRIRATPSVDYNGNLYLTNGVGLNSFTQSGAPFFSEIQLGGLSFVTPTLDSILDRMYIGISNKKFFALDLKKKGEIKWDFTVDAPISAPAVVTAGRKLLFTDVAGKLYGFDISNSLSTKTGDPAKWKYTLTTDSILLAPSLDTMEKIIVCTNKGKVIKLELDSSVIVNWSTNLTSKVTTSAVLDAYGHLYVATVDGNLHCLRSSDGAVLWSFNSGAPIISTPTISDQNRIYFANTKGDVYAIDTAKNIIWYYYGKDKVLGHLVHVNGATYIPTQTGSLKVIYDLGITNDMNTIQSQVTKRAIKTINVPKPIWATYQGNYRRTGMQDGIFKIIPDVDADDKSVIVYPNPCSGEFTIESLFGVKSIEFVDILGKLVERRTLPNATKYTLDVRVLPPGFYIVRVITERGIVLKKMIISI